MECPRCKSGEVGSTPSLTRRARPSSSLAFSSVSVINWEPPRFRSSIVPSEDSIVRPLSGPNAAPDSAGTQCRVAHHRPPSAVDNCRPLINLPDSRCSRIYSHEKNLSTFETHPQAPVWLPGPDENKGRKSDFGPAASARPEASRSRRRRVAIRASHSGLVGMVRPGRIRFRFPRSSRLSRASEFKLVKASGKSWTGKHLVLATLARDPDAQSRIGIVATRRLGNAVTRNRVRRKIREIFRLNQHRIRRGFWLVTIARFSSAIAAYEALERDWLRLAERASILAPGSHGSDPADFT
jgi:ribonuclease P protein component